MSLKLAEDVLRDRANRSPDAIMLAKAVVRLTTNNAQLDTDNAALRAVLRRTLDAWAEAEGSGQVLDYEETCRRFDLGPPLER